MPDLIDAMVAQFAALPELADVTVSDGYPLTNEPGTYLFVGVDDPESATRAASATATQEWPHATAHSRNEAGAVTLACESWNGDADQKAEPHTGKHELAPAMQDVAAGQADHFAPLAICSTNCSRWRGFSGFSL